MPCRVVMVRCEQMDRTRTNTTNGNPNDPRTACSDFRSDSKPVTTTPAGRSDDPSQIGVPQRVGESDHQGARVRTARINGFRKATAAARLGGGASPSKWTRRTRPWNASTPAAVVDSFHAGPRSATEVYSGGEVPEAIAGGSLGEPCSHAVRKGSRIHGSPVRPRAGRGRPERTRLTLACGPFLFPA